MSFSSEFCGTLKAAFVPLMTFESVTAWLTVADVAVFSSDTLSFTLTTAIWLRIVDEVVPVEGTATEAVVLPSVVTPFAKVKI